MRREGDREGSGQGLPPVRVRLRGRGSTLELWLGLGGEALQDLESLEQFVSVELEVETCASLRRWLRKVFPGEAEAKVVPEDAVRVLKLAGPPPARQAGTREDVVSALELAWGVDREEAVEVVGLHGDALDWMLRAGSSAESVAEHLTQSVVFQTIDANVCRPSNGVADG